MNDLEDVQIIRITDCFGLEIDKEKWGVTLPINSLKDIVGIQPSLTHESIIIHCKGKIIEAMPL